MIARRTFLEITAGTAAAAVAGACRTSSQSDRASARLRAMLNGAIYEELARRLVIEPFDFGSPG
jgi:hypothetical protein